MLTEHFVAAISASTKPNTGVTKDAGIFVHEYQPLAAQRHVFKKSAAARNGLAVSREHIFAAQEGKAVVHVYSRDKGNQEAIVPFPERIHSIALAAEDTVLLLGTESGRVLAWETCSGRMVSTSPAHLQPVTSLVVDPTSNFFLSGSADSMIHVWALPTILSFTPDTPRSPIHTLSTHRGPITSLVCGHSASSANIAISTSQDKTAIVWDYHNGRLLRTYLLPECPIAVDLDPADRAFYVAYEDGSLHTISFYDDVQQSTPLDTLRDGALSHRPIQPPTKTRFNADSQKLGGGSSLSVSWDDTTLISGHASGKVALWDIAKGTYISTLATLAGPVTNLHFLPPTGFPNTPEPLFKIHTITKPRQDLASPSSGSSLIPHNYSFNVQLVGKVYAPPISATQERKERKTEFEEALTHPTLPTFMLDEGIAELEQWAHQSTSTVTPAADFLSLSAGVDTNGGAEATLASTNSARNAETQTEMEELKRQVAALQRIQKVTFSQLSELKEERQYLLEKEAQRAKREQQLAGAGRGEGKNSRVNGHGNGNDADGDGDVEMNASTDEHESAASESESNDSDEDEDEDADEGDKSE
ncbi:WD40 repeat-like protein [Lophiostoma macrostomum CBS 122681]|uniref:Pre-rRNA-processing protein IPI3 n=1 Tax=Lophiostoma macrostomum CBS 122681 TaxID=1314788 RepID=A0A6A6SX97_9PLEO|nr:WD40 repeat-like protein [Lophiostoma macrostomum CBS 122681]